MESTISWFLASTITFCSSMISFFCVGVKCAQFLSEKWGKLIYSLYAIFAFSFFSFFSQEDALTLMQLSGACLLVVNLYGIVKLKDKISIH